MDTSKIWLVTFNHEDKTFEIIRLSDLVKIGINLYIENNDTKYASRVISAHETEEEAQEMMDEVSAMRNK